MRQGIKRLERLIAKVQEFKPSEYTPRSIKASAGALRQQVVDTLAKAFGDDTVEYNRYVAIVDRCWDQLTDELGEFGNSSFFATLTQKWFPEELIEIVNQYRRALFIPINEALKLLIEDLSSPEIAVQSIMPAQQKSAVKWR